MCNFSFTLINGAVWRIASVPIIEITAQKTMTNSPNSPKPSPNDKHSQSRGRRFLPRRKRSWAIAAGVIVTTVGVVGYAGVQYLVRERLPLIVENILSKIISRPVELGEVESFSLNSLRFGTSSVPQTATDPDYVTIDSIRVRFNLLHLLERRLPLDITLVDPDVYIEQDETGALLDLNLNLGDEEPLIDLSFDLNIEDGEIVVLPYGASEAIALQVNGGGTLADQDLTYDVEAALAEAEIELEGASQLDTWETAAQAKIEDLDLTQLAPLVPNLDVNLNSGELNADLDLAVPSLEEFTASNIEGTLRLQNVEGEVGQLAEPLQADARVLFEGSEALIEAARATLGESVASAEGIVNWQEPDGIDLDVDVRARDLANLLETVQVSTPVAVDGGLQLDVQVDGSFEDPILTGNLSSTEAITVDKLQFEQIRTEFSADLARFVLDSLQVVPAAGGAISGRGFIQTDIREALEEGLDFTKMPLSLNVDTRLPTEEVVAPYYNFPNQVSVGTLTAEGQVRGTLEDPIASVQFQIPSASAPSVENISGSGEIRLADNQLQLRNTQLQTDRGGSIALNGSSDLEAETWQASVNADSVSLAPFLSQIQNEQLQIRDPVALETADVELSGTFDVLENPDELEGVANLALDVAQGTVTVNSRIENGTVNATANVARIPVDRFLTSVSEPVTLNSAQATVSGSLEQLLALGDNPDLNRFDANFDAQLTAAGGTANATGRVDNGTVNASARAASIPLNPFVSALSEPVSLTRGQVDVSGPLEQLLALGDNPDLNRFDANFDAQLAAAGGTANATGRVDNGTINASARAAGIPIDDIIALSVPATLITSQVDVSGPLDQLLALRENPDLSRFDANFDANLAVAEGTVNATGQLDNNQWQTNLLASDLNTSLLNQQLSLVQTQTPLPDLNARVDLSGNLDPFTSPGVDTTIQANTVSVQLGEQFLDANGNILLSDLTTNPDAQVNLDVAARSNLESLPLTQLISQLPTNQQFLPQEIDATGQANFEGRLQGENLLSAPTAPGNLALTGDLRLLDFGLNGREFEPVLAGPVTVVTDEEIAINLRGEQDAIAAALEPCTRGEECLAPYLPASFELRQGAGTPEPVIATGTRVGDRLVADIENFPIGILNLAPAAEYGLPGEIGGELSADLDVNLFTLAASGDVLVTEPALGDRQGEEITASFSYRDNIAQLSSATASLGDSEYTASGRLNLNTNEVNASLDADGNVEEILTALNITSVDSATRFFGSPDYAAPALIQATSVGKPDASLATQLNLLYRVEQMLKQIAREREAPGIPTQLDIRGPFSAEVLVAGTLQNPALDFQVQGQDWRWRTQPAYPDLVPPLGLVIEDPQVLSIPEVLVDGTYVDGVATLEPARIEIGEALLALSGQFAADPAQASQGRFEVQNVSLDLLRNFTNIPENFAGDINAEGTVEGSLQNPQAQGNIAFVEGVVNGQPLNQPIAGDFRFADARLQFDSTEDSLVGIQANVPYPPEAENDQFSVNVDVDTEAIALIGAFTQGNIEWVNGEGQANVQARGQIDLSQGFSLNNLVATGDANLENATLSLNLGVLQQEELNLDGQLALNNQRLEVESLAGTFANSDFVATGVLPIFQPLSVSDPLTVTIEGEDAELEDLYEGSIDGRVVVTGAALSPVIGGEVRLYDGQAFVPKRNEENVQTEADVEVAALVSETDFVSADTPAATTGAGGGSAIEPILNDFEVTLGEDFKIQQRPFYRLNLEGDLTLNGPVTNLPQIRPDGTIYLRRGEISLFNNPGQLQNPLQNPLQENNTFNLVRGRDNVAVFEPSQGILNPRLDIQFVSQINEPDQTLRVRESSENEVPDDLFRAGRSDTIEVTLVIDGQASEIIPALANNSSKACQELRKPFPIPRENGYTESELDLLETCLVTATEGGTGLQLLDSPAVELTSSPPRSQGEIISLLGGQFLSLAQDLQNVNEETLLQFGVQQFLIGPILQDVLFGVQSAISGAGRSIGLADLRLYPAVEGIYRLNDSSSVSLTYDYSFNEVQVRYQTRF